MKTVLILIISLCVFSCNNSSQSLKDEEKLVEISEEILHNLDKGNFEEVRADFNEQMNKALSPEALASVWNQLETQLGEYKSKGEIITDMLEGYRVIYIISKFEHSPFKLKVIFDDENLVAGLFLIPVNQK